MKKYSIAICSNFINHFMLDLSLEILNYFDNFYYVVSDELPIERKRIGYVDLADKYDFVIKAYEDKERAQNIIMNCDIVIQGSYKYMNQIRKRVRAHKATFHYSERLFKTKNPIGTVLRYIKYFCRHSWEKDTLLLAISEFAATDYNKIGLFKDRIYEWAYLSSSITYENIDKLIKNKKPHSLMWSGRLVEYKHPDIAIELAKRLKDNDIDFELNIVGAGKVEKTLLELIDKYDLKNNVKMHKGMPIESLIKMMEDTEIYLFTSDYGEGWGMVLNEAMNSCCACVSCEEAGATKSLINNGVNGLTYASSNVDELYEKVCYLLENKKQKELIQKNAYQTIINEWNCKIAAERLFMLSDAIINGDLRPDLFDNGLLRKIKL